MTYAILDDKFHSNPKVLEVGNEGAGVYARALSFCGDHNTDGFVPKNWAKTITKPSVIRRMTEARLWRVVVKNDCFVAEAADGTLVDVTIPSDGFYIDDFLMLNTRREVVLQGREDLRRKRSEAGKKGAERRWQTPPFANGKMDGKPYGKPMRSPWQTDGPQPQPQLLKDSLQSQQSTTDGSSLSKLLGALTDATDRTEATVRKLITRGGLSEGDIAWAHECATGPGVKSPTRVAVAELRKRAEQRAA